MISGEAARIARALALVRVTGSIPRRLGIDATDEELAIDKKRARRTAWALQQSLGCWGKKLKIKPDEEIRPVAPAESLLSRAGFTSET
jgi:hypothetical protein